MISFGQIRQLAQRPRARKWEMPRLGPRSVGLLGLSLAPLFASCNCNPWSVPWRERSHRRTPEGSSVKHIQSQQLHTLVPTCNVCVRETESNRQAKRLRARKLGQKALAKPTWRWCGFVQLGTRPRHSFYRPYVSAFTRHSAVFWIEGGVRSSP